MEELINDSIDRQKQILFYYSPYNFIRDIHPEIQFNNIVRKKIVSFYNDPHPTQFIYETKHNEIAFTFLYQCLPWDTEFFKIKCYRFYTVLYAHFHAGALTEAIRSFRNHLVKGEDVYVFIDVPSEDILLIQCLGMAGFKMVETRLHFFKGNISQYDQEHYPVRKATPPDITAIMGVASNSRNEYDRVHADVAFSKELADSYLGVYAKSAVNGYCDAVLVPAEPGVKVDAFLAISHIQEDSDLLNCKLTRVVLTAVGPGNKGWHKKLVSETIYYAKDLGASYVLMTTQSTNRAVFRTSEKLGFQLGGTSHIFSYSKQ